MSLAATAASYSAIRDSSERAAACASSERGAKETVVATSAPSAVRSSGAEKARALAAKGSE